MRKNGHPILVRLLSLLLVAVIMLSAAVALVPFQLHENGESAGAYGSWMSETLDAGVRIVDVAMPGSHDSLAYEIDFLSDVDEASVTAPLDKVFLKGLAVRQSKTQELTVKEQLESGVRYLDIRASRNAEDEQWYGVHNFRSVALEDALLEVYNFLLSHPGEVVILDFQHCYDSREPNGMAGEQGAQELYELLKECGLTYFLSEDVALSTVTYGELTGDGARSAALVLMKETGGFPDILSYESSISSVWYNTDQRETVYSGLDRTAAQVRSGEISGDIFRVQQAVLTMQGSVLGVLRSIGSWSLLRRADALNEEWLSVYETRSAGTETDWLAAMPIVMMDNAGVGEAGEALMERLLEYDRALS